jgi:polysaccharide biosynthesis/export protein
MTTKKKKQAHPGPSTKDLQLSMKKLVLFLTLFLSAHAFAQITNQVGIINDINLRPEGDRFSILIVGQGKLEPNTIVIDNPPRIALDFPNVRNMLYPRTIEAETNSYVHRIRTSLYAKGRETISRITIDLKNRWDYGLYKTDQGVVLTLAPANQKASKEKEKENEPKSTKSPAATVPPPPDVRVPSSEGNGVTSDPNAKKTVQQQTNKPNVKPAVQQQQQTPQPAVKTPVQRQPNTPPPPVQTPQDIVIGSEDLLEISVFELPQFDTTTRVQGDGTITMPLVGSIEVRGLKKKDVEARIATALQAKYVNNANVSVNVKEYKSRQVSLLGEVKQPGAYYVMSQRTLLQLLSEAGGLSPAAGPKCYVFRPGASKIEIDLRDLMVNGNPALNIPIYPGDVVNVPADTKIVIYVLGAVRLPGAVHLSTSMPVTLLAAVAAAGGPTESAKQSDIKIKRRHSTGEENLIKVNLKDILSGKTEDIPLSEGDIITVPESFF